MPDFYFSEQWIQWFKSNRRDLPWRKTSDPYLIWVSEIILQQTRVDQGLDYYYRFTKSFPTVNDLADADQQSVLKLWQGLGYYSRARNMHIAAKEIVEHWNGVFPSDYKSILSLKGIGPYTAAAISSFAYSLPHAVVDGNVYRVLGRLFDIEAPIDKPSGQRIYQELATQLLNPKVAGEHNQSIMEFGALHCTPTSPKCIDCPLNTKCLALSNKTINKRPVKAGKTAILSLYLYSFYFQYKDETWIMKRLGKGIWQNLFQLPTIESNVSLSFDQIQNHPLLLKWSGKTGNTLNITLVSERRHLLSHRNIMASCYTIDIKQPIEEISELKRIPLSDLSEYPMPRLMELFLEELFINE